MERLIAGYRTFRADAWPRQRAVYEQLARDGQRPHTLVLACSDSRVDPAAIFDAGPGELFVIRNVANLVPPYAPDEKSHGTSAALEFGVRVLQVQEIIVMGHAMCGGVKGMLRGLPPGAQEFVGPWINLAAPACLKVLACLPANEDREEACELETVRLSLRNLLTFPWIAERVSNEHLVLRGAWFDVRSGELRIMGSKGAFEAI